MKRIVLFLYILLIVVSCRQKKSPAAENTAFFPVLSFLKSQAAEVDTSVYPLLKIVTIDSTSDSSYIKREEFKHYASDFLSLPDIGSKELKNQYTETKLFDETLGRVVLDYTPKNSEAEIRREEVMIIPDAETGDKVQSVIIDRLVNSNDSTVQKRMFWQVAKRFQIVNIVQKNNQPDKVVTTEIVWNDFHPAE
jgi:hypothetical protein